MTDLILHHYDLSPFSEKVRLALGHKHQAWHAVEIPIWPPRPGTEPLTAGYRRSPVLQIGADIYCDTLLILREIERRHPAPVLYPAGLSGLVQALSQWAERALFMPVATLTTSIIGDQVPQAFLDDRVAFMKHDFSKQASLQALPLNRQRVTAAMTALADMLGDGRPFLLGANVSAADLSAYHPLWFARKNGGAGIEALLSFDALHGWMERIAAIGYGERHAMTPEAALDIAKVAEPVPTDGVIVDDASGLKGGERVLVHTDEPGEPITGTLVAANASEIVIRHEHQQVGFVHVHFPRLGYSVVAQ